MIGLASSSVTVQLFPPYVAIGLIEVLYNFTLFFTWKAASMQSVLCCQLLFCYLFHYKSYFHRFISLQNYAPVCPLSVSDLFAFPGNIYKHFVFTTFTRWFFSTRWTFHSENSFLLQLSERIVYALTCSQLYTMFPLPTAVCKAKLHRTADWISLFHNRFYIKCISFLVTNYYNCFCVRKVSITNFICLLGILESIKTLQPIICFYLSYQSLVEIDKQAHTVERYTHNTSPLPSSLRLFEPWNFS